MAKIVVGDESFTDVEAAQKAMSNLFGITEECALWYMLWDVSFEDEEVNDKFMVENEDSAETSVRYVEAYLRHEKAEDMVFKSDANLQNYNDITEMN